jgi:hypothetical protein
MRVGVISEIYSNNEDDITYFYIYVLKKCSLQCRCVTTGSVYQVLFYFMFIGDFILHAEVYDRSLRHICSRPQFFPDFCKTLRFPGNLVEYSRVVAA